jgi:acetyl-CoA carboxylase biotin carboxyl carrier protein
MDLREIQNLIRFVSKSEVAEVKYKDKEFEISIKTNTYHNGNVAVAYQTAPQIPITSPTSTSTQPQAEASKPSESATENSNLITIKAPMIGTFYRKSGPDKPIFVSEGDEIKPGKVLCIIEAMKLFNEIESEISGKVVKVLVDDKTPVEFDQPLFLVEPN